MRKITIPIFFILLIWIADLCPGAQQAVIKEEKQVFKTYPFSDPDPTPNIGRIYPYFNYSGYSHTGKNREWQVVRLENPYVKVLVTPQIGGKVWGAVEKSTGRAFIYLNKVVKFRAIAMRGPWTSGGIEFNFGAIGHAPSCAAPVDYLLKKNSDGSVSCFVGAMDLPSRSQWRVEIRLPKDSAYFETKSYWYNPTPLHHSYYHWMNAAADSGSDLHFYFPGQNYIDHGGRAFSWPMDSQGRDISIYGNNNFGPNKSYHVLGNYTEFFGGYWQDSGFGFGNWSLYDHKPGKKIWIWALSRQGAIWRDLLTDKGNKQYVEIQSGLLLNQAGENSSLTPFKHAYFAPYASTRAAEIWFPVKDIGGMVAANACGALNVSREGSTLRIGFCPLQPISDELAVYSGGEKIYTAQLRLKPMEVFLHSLEIPAAKGGISVTLGKNKLVYSSGAEQGTRLQRPVTAPADYDWNSAEGLFTAGEELAKQRRYTDALEKFSACLEKEPYHIRALTRSGGIYFRRGEYKRALKYAAKALSIDTYHAGGNFIYGLAQRQLGNFFDAKDGFGWAARSLEYGSAAYTQLAEIYLLEKNYPRAELYANRALDYNRYNLTAFQALAIACRKQEKTTEAQKILEQILNIDPLNHFVYFEIYLLPSARVRRTQPMSRFAARGAFLKGAVCRSHASGYPLDPPKKLLKKNTSAGESLKNSIRSELPQETYLELAIYYAGVGLKKEAVTILDSASHLDYPTIYYWLAYLHKDNPGSKSRQFLTQALQTSPRLVFPFRRETIPVLKWSETQKPHWKSKYYLGLILWNKGRLKEALELFELCGSVPGFAPFYTARGKLLKEKGKSNPEKIIKDFEKAVRLEPGLWQARHVLYKYYHELARYDDSLTCSKAAYQKSPGNYILALDYAAALLNTGKFKKCLDVLAKTKVLPYEGAREGRDIYRQANLFYAARAIKTNNYGKALKAIAKARLWPENLGVGRPYTPDERPEDYLAAFCYEQLGKKDKAKEFYLRVNAYTQKNWRSWGAVHYVGALALRKTGQADKARKLLAEWLQAPGDNTAARWSLAMFNREPAAAREIIKKKTSLSREGTPWNPAQMDRDFPFILKLAAHIPGAIF